MLKLTTVLATAFIAFTSNNILASQLASPFVQNEINEAHKAYLTNNTSTGLYALNSLARLLLEVRSQEVSATGNDVNLASTYFRIGLLYEKEKNETLKNKYFSKALDLYPNQPKLSVDDFRHFINKLDNSYSKQN